MPAPERRLHVHHPQAGAVCLKRILYVTDGFAPFVIGGMQSFARRQLEDLASSKHELISISSRGAEPSGLPWRNIHISWPGRSALRRLSPWRYVGDLRRFSARVAEVIDLIAPDLVYSEGPLLHAWLHRRDRQTPAIFNPHGLEMFQGKGTLTEDLKSLPLRRIVTAHARVAEVTVSLSEDGQLMHILRDRIGIQVDRIAVLSNAAPASRAGTRRTSARADPQFLFVGRDEPRKALPLLLDAFRNTDRGTLNVVGVECPPAAVPRTKFHGVVRDPERLRRFYADADFLVVPSHAEGMPTVILEAFASGLPAIATDVGATADLVRPNESGFLVPPADAGALARAIRQAAALPPDLYSSLSANALALAAGPYSAESARKRLLTLVEHTFTQGKLG